MKNTNSVNRTALADEDSHFKHLKSSLDHVCSEIAKRFNLCLPNGEPRTAVIIDILASSPSIEAVIGKLQRQRKPEFDAVYLENHKLAVGVLVERVQSYLANRGYEVSVLTEAEGEHGTADVLITPTMYGVNLQHNSKTIIVEVKTGHSLSYSQLFRYLLDHPGAIMVLWRIKERQVAVLPKKEVQPMLRAFIQMCILRGERVLRAESVASPTPQSRRKIKLSAHEFENTVKDFSEGLMETLPVVLETILQEIRSAEGNQDAH